MNPLLACPKCRAWLLDGVFNQPAMAPCPACGAPVRVEAFPALFRAIAPGQSAQPVMIEGESSCFFHPQKKAVVPCAGCGRFLCALCDCEFGGKHLCPACLEAGKTKGKIAALENQRTRYDSIALGLAVFPMLFFYFTILTAPMALFVVIRYWNTPRSLVRRGRFRFILAGLIALMQIAGWLALFFFVTGRHRVIHG
jgi:hypothetical protein